MSRHAREDLRPLTKVNTPGHWILVTTRRRIILSDCSAVRICSQAPFFLLRSPDRQNCRGRCVSSYASSKPIQRNIISARCRLSYYRAGTNLFNDALIDGHETVDATKRNVNPARGVDRSISLLSCVSTPGTWRFPGLNLPSALSACSLEKKAKQRVNVFTLISLLTSNKW